MRRPVLVTALAAAAGSASAAAAPNICGSNSTIGQAVVAAVNLTYPGLRDVAAAVAAGDLNSACDALASYYAATNTTYWLRVPPVAPGTGLAGGYADPIVFNDTFYFSGVKLTTRVPRNPDGGLNWLYKGPYDDVEAMNCNNRHDAFGFLLDAWRSTGNPIYSRYFDAMVADWVLHLPCPDALSGGAPCVPLGLDGTACSWQQQGAPDRQACKTGTMESPWRSLEMGIRMVGSWPTGFFGFQGAPEFSVSSRVLFVLAVSEHNAALVVDGGHPGSGTPNWEMTQWQGLLTSSLVFPELNNATGLTALAVSYLNKLLAAGVYPDGVETEQASGYDMGTAGDFFGTIHLLSLANHTSPQADFVEHVEAMWDYGTYASDPSGCLPRNGDSDICGSGFSPDTAAFFNRSDWVYVHTNGANGTVPPEYASRGPSSVFPWAGQVVLRGGYDADATWGFFDVGPFGSSGHGHRDKLHFNLHARRSMLLVDSGRFSYSGDDLSETLHFAYARNASAHNTLTLDGADQQAAPSIAPSPIPDHTYSRSPEADWAYGSMDLWSGLSGSATHTRGVYYQRLPPGAPQPAGNAPAADGDWFVVVDTVTSDRPRDVQVTWHMHPNASFSVNPVTGSASVGGAKSGDGEPTKAQVCVVPALQGATASWSNVSVVRGQYANATTGTPWQGWFSTTYADAWPAPVLVYDAPAVPPTAYFAWLLVPSYTRRNCDGSLIAIVSANATAVVVDVVVDSGGPATQKARVAVPIGFAG